MKTIKLPTGVFEYDETAPLGKPGGFGQVFLGKSSKGEEIAVKKLHLSATAAAHRELRIAEELRGRAFEHVVPFIDAGEDADTGGYFVVMPKAVGSLQALLEKNGPPPAAEVPSILLQMIKGLIEVGELVHRDLKPDNVLFHDDRWKIADFGIARFVEEATESNTLKNCLTPWYAAPEQWRSERASHETDVYALGCIAFYLITGAPPFTNDPQAEHLSAPVPNFNCNEPRLTTLVNMCLRKVARSRPSLTRVRELLTDIVEKPAIQSGSSLKDLANAAASVSAKEQELQAREAASKAASDERRALGESGFEILSDNVERLWRKIQSQAANAKRVSSGQTFECGIGNAKLMVNLSKSNFVDAGSFPHSGWDVIGSSQILVLQLEPRYCWSASLWFAKIKGQTEYRWHEASYWSIPGLDSEPCSLGSGRDADLAASNICHSVNFAFGPLPIDDEKEDEFHERWIWLLSKAAVGELGRPKRMPFGWPPPLS